MALSTNGRAAFLTNFRQASWAAVYASLLHCLSFGTEPSWAILRVLVVMVACAVAATPSCSCAMQGGRARRPAARCLSTL